MIGLSHPHLVGVLVMELYLRHVDVFVKVTHTFPVALPQSTSAYHESLFNYILHVCRIHTTDIVKVHRQIKGSSY